MAKKKKNSLVGNINKRKKAGKSRSKKKSTISREAYRDMQQGWPQTKKPQTKKPRKKKKKAAKKSTR